MRDQFGYLPSVRVGWVGMVGSGQVEERLTATEAELEVTVAAKTDLEQSLEKVTESLTELYIEREADQEEARWQANVDAHVFGHFVVPASQ